MTIILTICSANYLAHAACLGDSIRTLYPDFRFVIGLVDNIPENLGEGYLEGFEVIPASDLQLECFGEMLHKYNIVELNTAVKPYFMRFLYERDSVVKNVVYLDPDMLVYHGFEKLIDSLSLNNIVITPHSCTYENSAVSIHYERVMLYAGVYNLGFIGTSRSQETMDFLKWWEIRLKDYCFFSPGVAGSFFDQLWIGLVPGFFNGVRIERNPGCNVSYWNHFERRLEERGGKYFVNNAYELAFVHFSSYKPENPQICATRKTEPICSFVDRPDLRPIYDDYRNRLIARSYYQMKSIPWHYAPPVQTSRKTHFKTISKNFIRALIGRLPARIRYCLIRFARFVAQAG